MDNNQIIKAFSALSQDTRLRILTLLAQAGSEGLPAGDISLALGVPQNTLSFHLAHMEAADLLTRRRAGRFIIYSANRKTLDGLIVYMAENLRETPVQKTA